MLLISSVISEMSLGAIHDECWLICESCVTMRHEQDTLVGVLSVLNSLLDQGLLVGRAVPSIRRKIVLISDALSLCHKTLCEVTEKLTDVEDMLEVELTLDVQSNDEAATAVSHQLSLDIVANHKITMKQEPIGRSAKGALTFTQKEGGSQRDPKSQNSAPLSQQKSAPISPSGRATNRKAAKRNDTQIPIAPTILDTGNIADTIAIATTKNRQTDIVKHQGGGDRSIERPQGSTDRSLEEAVTAYLQGIAGGTDMHPIRSTLDREIDRHIHNKVDAVTIPPILADDDDEEEILVEPGDDEEEILVEPGDHDGLTDVLTHHEMPLGFYSGGRPSRQGRSVRSAYHNQVLDEAMNEIGRGTASPQVSRGDRNRPLDRTAPNPSSPPQVAMRQRPAVSAPNLSADKTPSRRHTASRTGLPATLQPVQMRTAPLPTSEPTMRQPPINRWGIEAGI